MADQLRTELALDALRMARRARRPGAGLLHHTDRGSQYTAAAYQAALAARGSTCSMSRAGACRDNAMAGRCFATLQAESTDTKTWPTRDAARLAIFVVALAARRVVHVGVTRHPTDAWVAQQLREATPFARQPRYRIRDRDSTYGSAFARVAAATGIVELRTAYRAPRQNATCARFLGSVRRECLDHVLVLDEAHLRRVLREYVPSFNQDRPHQGLRQHIPGAAAASPGHAGGLGNVRAFPVLGGLHHAYQRVA